MIMKHWPAWVRNTLLESAEYHKCHHMDEKTNMAFSAPFMDIVRGTLHPKYKARMQTWRGFLVACCPISYVTFFLWSLERSKPKTAP